jgi:hypothetical protein
MHETATHAIVVAGHAVIHDASRPLDDSSWALLPYQAGEPAFYIEHVRSGVEATAADPRALLIFSGGATRTDVGPRSEAQGYFDIASHYEWFGLPGVAHRAATEEFARDSYENLLFSICRFRQAVGRYCERVTFVSWRFKERRFALHRRAIRWPEERFCYLGPNNPRDLQQALAAEENTRRGYDKDPYSASAEFRSKRDARNPFGRTHDYLAVCPELRPLFEHQGPEWFRGPLPWTAS